MSQHLFRKTHVLQTHQSSSKYIGVFDYELEIDNISLEITQEIIDWCSKTCISNFIIIQSKDRIVAGGNGDNYLAWESGEFKASKRWKKDEFDYTVYIRLMRHDYNSFILRYSDEITSTNKE